jgi:pimeloyl-ACP methyl ester carboxylesterase
MSVPSAPTRRRRRRWRRLGVGLLALLLAAIALPYLIPRRTPPATLPPPPFPNGAYHTLDGVRWHVRHWPGRAPSAPRVLLLHGFSGSTYSWRMVAPALAESGYDVYAVDLWGFGYSERRRAVDDEVGALWSLLDRMAPGGAWCLVGHSMGADVAGRMAARRPRASRSLVLVGGGVRLQARPPPAWSTLLALPPLQRAVDVYASWQLYTPERIGALLASAYGRPATADEVAGYLRPLQLADTSRAILERMTRARPPVDRAALDRPILALWGARDTWVPLSVGERMREVLGAELVVLPEQGHCPMETAPETFLEPLFDFFRRHCPLGKDPDRAELPYPSGAGPEPTP